MCLFPLCAAVSLDMDKIGTPKKHISISILWGYPYLIGLLYKGVYMGPLPRNPEVLKP